MEDNSLRFKRSEKISEGSTLIAAIAVLLLLQLPADPKPDRPTIYIVAIFIVLFNFGWHKVKLPLIPENKNFLEALVGLGAISVIVFVSGGINSYFSFLFILPNLAVSTTSSRLHAVLVWLVSSLILLWAALFFSQDQPWLVSLFYIWAIGIVNFFGRFLSGEVTDAQGDLTAATIEKEKAVNKLKDEFVFLISHELRGPITAIRGYLELFINSLNNNAPEVKNFSALAFKQSEKLNNLIMQLLDLSRLETDKFKLSDEKIDIDKFAQEMLEDSRVEAEEKKLKLSYKSAGGQAVIFADRDRLKEVLINLLENAFKYTGEFGQVWVWNEIRGGFVYTSIADTGVGIPIQDLPNIFSRFYQSSGVNSGSDAEKGKHIGLGLYLTKQLVEKMGGHIQASSQLGKGSKFTFSLPLAKAEENS